MDAYVTTGRSQRGLVSYPVVAYRRRRVGSLRVCDKPIARGNEKVQAALAATPLPEGGAAPPAYQHILEAAKGTGRYLAGTGAESMSTPGKALATAATTLIWPSRVAGVIPSACRSETWNSRRGCSGTW